MGGRVLIMIRFMANSYWVPHHELQRVKFFMKDHDEMLATSQVSYSMF